MKFPGLNRGDPKTISIVSETDAAVGKSVRDIVEESTFLKLSKGEPTAHDPSSSLAQFQRNEIHVGKLLGEGSYCQVYEVKKFTLSRNEDDIPEEENVRKYCRDNVKQDGQSQYVIKHVNKSLAKDSAEKFHRAAADLVTEAMYLSRMDHPNIIKVRGVAMGGSSAFVDGKHDSLFILSDRLYATLENRIIKWKKKGDKNITEDSVVNPKVNYALQIANGVRYLHERRIILRDLKPENIGFSANDDVKLFDFGLCIELPPGEHSKETLFPLPRTGTPRYSSPEMLLGLGYNFQTDVYAFALVFYEMLSLETAYDTYLTKDFYLDICMLRKRPKVSSLGFPKTLTQIMKKGWEHDISCRLSIRSVCRLLENYLSDHETPSCPIPKLYCSKTA